MKTNILKDISFTLSNNTANTENITFNDEVFIISPQSKLTLSNFSFMPGSGIPFSIQIDGFSEQLWLRFDIDIKGEYFTTTIIELNGWWVREMPGTNEINFLYINEATQTIHRFTIVAIGILIVGTTDNPELVFSSKK